MDDFEKWFREEQLPLSRRKKTTADQIFFSARHLFAVERESVDARG
jgi:hypothetical protein